MSNLNELQEVELDLLKIYVEFCQKHDLRYFLCGGSLIGAVRHHGFIPWDDDIDVAMPRPDFDKFCELAKEEFKGDIFFQSFKTDKAYPYCFCKLRNSKTTFIEKLYQHLKMNHGVYIDIFPIDGISKKNKTNRKKLFWKVFFMGFLFYLVWPSLNFRKPRLKWFIIDILIDILVAPFLLFRINNWAIKIYEKKMKKISYNEATYVGLIQCGNYLSNQIYPSYLFEEEIDCQFEDLIVKIPKEYDEILTMTYGDYMTPPPPNKQVGHHYNSGYDMHVSYVDYNKNKKARTRKKEPVHS